MTEISATLVKELRDKTGSGIMDCKQALKENAGDIEKALDFLRKKVLPQLRNVPEGMPRKAWFSHTFIWAEKSVLWLK